MKRQSRTPTTRGWHPKAFTKRARTCLCAYVCTRIYQMNECTVTSSSYECSVNTSKRIPPTPLIINTTWDPNHERADRTIRYRSYYFDVYNITWVGLGLWSTAAVVYTPYTATIRPCTGNHFQKPTVKNSIKQQSITISLNLEIESGDGSESRYHQYQHHHHHHHHHRQQQQQQPQALPKATLMVIPKTK